MERQQQSRTEMEQPKIFHIRYAPGKTNLPKNSFFENFSRVADIMNRSPLPMPSLPSVDELKEERRRYHTHRRRYHTHRIRYHTHERFLIKHIRDQVEYFNVLNMRPIPRNRLNELVNDPKYENANNFFYMLDSMKSREMQVKVVSCHADDEDDEDDDSRDSETDEESETEESETEESETEESETEESGTEESETEESENEESETDKDAAVCKIVENGRVENFEIENNEVDISTPIVTKTELGMVKHKSEEDMSGIEVLPDIILLKIFSSLDLPSLTAVQSTCSRLHTVSRDNVLWKPLFRQHFNIHPSVLKPRPDQGTWEEVFKSLKKQQNKTGRKARGNIENYFFIFYLPNVMHRPDPNAYLCLFDLLKRARKVTIARYNSFITSHQSKFYRFNLSLRYTGNWDSCYLPFNP